ncbi:dual specificity protein kinase splA [Spatholobus suberectus]|nr:dual specificity protein kinase splA [Spatholobus suberectus]
MEAQPTPSPHPNYPDSVDSSPRASWDEPFTPPTAAKLRLMCSYGGHIVPRPQDKSLCYVGGDTRIVVVPRHTSLSDLSTRLSKSFPHARPFVLKYQLPGEDLDSLVSVTTDEDLENMIDEYDQRAENSSSNNKPSRIRLFLFPAQVVGPAGLGSAKSEEWLSGSLDGGLSESASVTCLLGLNDEVASSGNGKVLKEVVADSPVLESNSSFGSASSVANLPPIKVHVEDGVRVPQDQKGVGLEEQFAQFGVGQKQEEAFVLPPPPATEFAATQLVSDDERSDHGVPLGYRKLPTPQPQPPQFQQKSVGVVDLPSPDSLSSDSSLSNAMSCPKPAIYQDQVQIQSGNSQVPSNTSVDLKLNVTDPHGWIQMQQHVQEPGYVLQPQFDQQLPQQQQQHQAQQPQQYIHNTHLIHHTPAGPVPIPAAYYPVYQQQLHTQHHHHLDQQYPVYYVQARQAQAYNLSVQPANVAESATTIPSSQSQNLPNYAAYNPMRNAPLPKSEMTAGAYRTAPATPQLVQVPPSKHQQQYVAYSQIHHHHPQSVPPNSAVPANYAYDYADPAFGQVFYTQPLHPPCLPSTRP